MREQFVPRVDVNSEEYTVLRWHVADGAAVEDGDLIAEVETQKSDIEVYAEGSGLFVSALKEGATVSFDQPIGGLVDLVDEVPAAVAAFAAAEAATALATGPALASEPARALAAAHGIDLAEIASDGLITTADVEAHLARTQVPTELPEPLVVPVGTQRLLLIGAGLGATQVLEMLRSTPNRRAVAMVDDDTSRWGTTREEVPVVGGANRIAELVVRGAVDGAVITISTSIAARVRLRQLCEDAGLPLVNVIDPSCRIAADAQLGRGNVLCAFCHIGAGAVLGDNNFLSAYNSFDHHCEMGSDNSTGPGVMASGLVIIGSRVRMGTGIYIQPHVEIGDDVLIASGAVLTQMVPAGHTVKVPANQVRIVPTR